MTRRALVLGGGGPAGIAWETGLLAGLAERGLDVRDADLVVGTSAGAAVAAQLGSGLPMADLLARQVDPARQARELSVELDLETLLAAMADIGAGAVDAAEVRRRTGAMALAASTVAEAERWPVIADRVPVADWPRGPGRGLLLVAVDAETGEPRYFDRESGVDLVDAVAASCAVPGVWPPVTIGDRRYMDGGVRSGENADLAAGHDRVLVLSVFEVPAGAGWGPELATDLEALRAGGSVVELVRADRASLAAIGPNPLDPGVRAAAATAGARQGREAAAGIARFWT